MVVEGFGVEATEAAARAAGAEVEKAVGERAAVERVERVGLEVAMEEMVARTERAIQAAPHAC
eukprot:6049364-Prymnesium_polylepis.1